MSLLAIAGAGASIAGDWANSVYQSKVNDLNYSREKAFIDRMNEYNHPKNQLARWKEAGINPKYVLGGTSNTQPSAGSSNAQPPQIKADAVLKGIEADIAASTAKAARLDAPLKREQGIKTAAQADLAAESTRLLRKRSKLIDAQVTDLQNSIDYYTRTKHFREADIKKAALQTLLNSVTGNVPPVLDSDAPED